MEPRLRDYVPDLLSLLVMLALVKVVKTTRETMPIVAVIAFGIILIIFVISIIEAIRAWRKVPTGGFWLLLKNPYGVIFLAVLALLSISYIIVMQSL